MMYTIDKASPEAKHVIERCAYEDAERRARAAEVRAREQRRCDMTTVMQELAQQRQLIIALGATIENLARQVRAAR